MPYFSLNFDQLMKNNLMDSTHLNNSDKSYLELFMEQIKYSLINQLSYLIKYQK